MANAVGIIAEYNPFHNGHAYHIEQAKKTTQSDCAVVVMSGNFVQRGEPAVLDKYVRSRLALSAGADLVVELPVTASTGSAQYFAKGSIQTLSALKVSSICFGSESGDIAPFTELANQMINHKDCINSTLHELMSSGISYPLAREKAIRECISGQYSSDFFSLPNNILGLEYILEIYENHIAMTPYTIQRTGNFYHETTLSDVFSSAAAIRANMSNDYETLYQNIPEKCVPLAKEYLSSFKPVFWEDFSELIYYRLLEMDVQKKLDAAYHCNIADLPDFLLNKLLSHLCDTHSVTALIEAVKSKDLTYTRISRALIHLLLGLTTEDYKTFQSNPCPYIRVLGFTQKGQRYLSFVKKELSCPLIVKPANYKALLQKDIYASNLYNMVLSHKSKTNVIQDYQRPIK